MYIQNNLHADLSLETVAAEAGLSPTHFHRTFRQQLDETPRAYVERLRIEKSRYDLRITTDRLIDIAQRYGFSRPETYSRAYQRVFGYPPSAEQRLGAGQSGDGENTHSAGEAASAVRRVMLPEIHLAAIRHTGPYEQVPLIASVGDNPWQRLSAFVLDRGLSSLPLVHFGIPLDAPGTTPDDRLRYDMAIQVDAAFTAKRSDAPVFHSHIAAGQYAVLTHAGPYATLAEAWPRLFQTVMGWPGVQIRPAQVFECLIDIKASALNDHTWTDLYLPIETKR